VLEPDRIVLRCYDSGEAFAIELTPMQAMIPAADLLNAAITAQQRARLRDGGELEATLVSVAAPQQKEPPRGSNARLPSGAIATRGRLPFRRLTLP
jgi:hypothetical protein